MTRWSYRLTRSVKAYLSLKITTKISNILLESVDLFHHKDRGNMMRLRSIGGIGL